MTPVHTPIQQSVFQNRNTAYGAFQLRKRYNKNMTLGILISIGIFLTVVLFYGIEWNQQEEYEMMQEVQLEPIPELELPKFSIKHSPSTNQAKKQIPKDSEKKKVVKEEQKQETKPQEIATKDTSDVKINSESKTDASENSGDQAFDFVDVMPQYPGGSSSLAKFISSKLVYPNTALRNKIEGVVIVGFVVDKEGKVRNPRIIKSLYPACDEEALRVLRLIDQWIPAKNANRNVSFNFKMPIEFKLNR
ncbi:MAG TPA: TonB family protein [Saprospiraceae bacterium]|nr:TonB family protein [Saprospiraceae bacterium]